MEKVRKSWTLNYDLPGCIELEDPNRFLPYLKPKEEFPHTPVIPIDENRMKEF